MDSYRITDPSGRTVGYAHGPGAEALGLLVVMALVVVVGPIVLVVYGVSLYWSWATTVLPISSLPNVNGLVVTGGLFALLTTAVALMDRLARIIFGHNLIRLAGAGFVSAYMAFAFVVIGAVVGGVPLLVIRWLLMSESATHSLWPWAGDLFPVSLFYPYVASLMGLAGGPATVVWNRGNGAIMSYPLLTAMLGLTLPWLGMQMLRFVGFPGAEILDTETLGMWSFWGTLLGGFTFGSLVLPWTRWMSAE